MIECRYLGKPTGQRLKVRCPRIGGATQVEPLYGCLHPDRLRRARRGRLIEAPGLCLPTWDGPWILPDQAADSAMIELCSTCRLRACKM